MVGILTLGDRMKSNKEILSSILKTTQMGQLGIRSVEKYAVSDELRTALADQLKEYDRIETKAHEITTQRGWKVKELNPALRKSAEIMAHSRLAGKEKDTKIAGMMMRGNTQGVIKGLKNLHRFDQQDEKILTLAQQLIDCEKSNIRQMENFL